MAARVLAALRMAGALLLVLAALVLAGAVRRAAERLADRDWPGWLRGSWPPALVGAALCYYTVFVRTPSYNWFAALGLMVAAAGLLEALGVGMRPTDDTVRRRAHAAGGLAGLGLFLTAVGKATTALAALVVLVVVVLALLLSAGRAARAPLLRAVAAATTTGAILAALHLSLVAGPERTLTAYRRAAAMLALVDPDHYAPDTVGATVRQGLGNVVLDRPEPYLGFIPFLLLVALLMAVPALRPRWRVVGGPEVALALGASYSVVVAVVLFRVLTAYPGGVLGLGMSAPSAVVPVEAALLTGTLWLVVGRLHRSAATSGRPTGTGQARPGLAVVSALALAGLGVAYPIGTNVEYSTQLHGAFPVLVSAAVLGVCALPGPGRGAALASLVVGALVLGAVLVPTTRALAPYRIAPLGDQVLSRSIPAGTAPVLVDPDTATWVDDLRRLGADGGLTPGSPVLDLTWHPASVLALDGRAPSVLLPAFPGWPDPGASAAYALRQEDPRRWRGAWLLVPQGQDTSVAAAAVAVLDRSFPGDYELLGTVTAPYDGQVQGLWRPRSPGPD